MTLQNLFEKDFNEFKRLLPDSQDVEYAAQEIVNDIDFDIENDIIVTDMMEEDLASMLKDFVISMIERNPEQVWEFICEENSIDDIIAYMYAVEDLYVAKAMYGKPFDDWDKYGVSDVDLMDAMQRFIENAYAFVQGGWFDDIYDAYAEAVIEKYNELKEME